MNTFGWDSTSAWLNNKSAIKNVVIEDGVTSIGDYAFSGCSSLTSIIIPDGVTSIGGAAFYGCSGLTSITIPDGVTSIGDCAFQNCSSLTSIIIPDSVTSIGDQTFCNCNSLTSIIIPDGVTSIGEYAFYGCSSLTSITIPDGVTSIGEYAFHGCRSLTSIRIPNGVTSIGDGTFVNCSSLTSISIPASVTSIGRDAFFGCSSMTSIRIPNGVTSIGDGTFKICSSLTSISIPASVTSIGISAFSDCRNLTSINIPDSVTSIDNSAFYGCSSLTSIIIPDGVTSIGNSAFNGCSSLTSIIIPDGVISIGEWAFFDCDSLTSITIPDGVTNIGSFAFNSCSSLTSIIIPDGVTSIGNQAFLNCNSLTSISIPDGVTSIGEYTFYGCSSLTSITIPDGVTSIGDYAFWGCANNNGIILPDNITSVGRRAFSGKAYATVGSKTAKAMGKTENSFYPVGEKYALRYIYNGEELSGLELTRADYDVMAITIPEGVTSIGEYAFSVCTSLTSITIPDSVTSIGNWAFQACWGMQKILIPRSVQSFSDEVFGDMYYEGTVYCYRNSKADEWAGSYGYDVVYLDDVTEDDISEVFLPESFKMLIGTERNITAAVFPDAHKTVTWSSSDPQVAEVQDGHIRALSAGTADITAACGTASASVKVTVFLPVESFELPEEIWIEVGAYSNINLTARNIQPANADVQLTWTCSENLSLEMNYTGNCSVYANKVGDGTVVGTDISGVSRTVIVHVCPRVKSVIFDPTEYTVHVGEKIQLHAFAKSGNTTYENKLVFFYSQNYSVASVNEETGIVYGNSVGTTQIWASPFSANPDNMIHAACTVTVIAADESTYTLPAGLTAIEDEAFMGAGFERVIIPDGCRSIGHLAFANCSRLMYIRIPASVTEIAEDAFDGCSAELVIDRRSN